MSVSGRLRGQVLPEQDRFLRGEHEPMRERGQMPRSVHALHLRLSTGIQVGSVPSNLHYIHSMY